MAQTNTYDLVIIGSGPGGYVAAARAAQQGMKVACIEKESRLGGVCLRVGCIPSKALLDSSEYYHMAKETFATHGIKTGRVTLDLGAMMARKDKVVEDLTQNVASMLKRNKVTIIQGTGSLAATDQVLVTDDAGKQQTLAAKYILLATGSEPFEVPGLPFDGDYIVSSTEALNFETVPKQLGVVGGGYIGLELGSVWARLGSKVTVIEMLPKIAMALDGQIGRTLQRILKKQGLVFRLKSKVTGAKVSNKKVQVSIDVDGKTEKLKFDRLLVAVGRRPLTRPLNLEAAAVQLEEKSGQIIVDEHYRSSTPNIYAIGDLIAGPMLAHKASAEGIAAVDHMAGKVGEVDYDTLPAVIYTWPEVAGVGLTEEQVKARNIDYRVGNYPFIGTGRARCLGETDGFVKILASKKTDRVLGIHIIGPRASELIAECVMAMTFNASSEDIARTIHSHPTFSEAIMEAAMAVR